MIIWKTSDIIPNLFDIASYSFNFVLKSAPNNSELYDFVKLKTRIEEYSLCQTLKIKKYLDKRILLLVAIKGKFEIFVYIGSKMVADDLRLAVDLEVM